MSVRRRGRLEGREWQGWRAAALVAVLAAVSLVTGCGGDQPGDRPGAEAGEELPDQEIIDFVLRETEDGAVAWVLRAQTAEIYEGRDAIHASELTIDFYEDDGTTVSSVLTADRGVVNRRDNAMVARGNVVVEAADGRVLETEELEYSPQTGKITTEAFVRVVDGRNVLTGYGLESDPDLDAGSFEIKRDVQATVLDPPEEGGGG